jgi:succinate dehydrogenase subunit C
MSTPVTRVPSYQRRMSVFWWVHKRSYFLFVMRELSSLFVAWFVIYLLMFIAAVGGGAEKYDAFLDRASSPLFLVVNAVALAFLVLHTITWFALTPQAMVLNLGGRRVPGVLIIVAQYVGLAAVSAFIYWLVVLA